MPEIVSHTTPPQPHACSAARTVFCISIAMVIGPTPPGLGVILPATACTSAKSTSPTNREPPLATGSLMRFTPTSTTTAPPPPPGLTQARLHEPRKPHRRYQNVRSPAVAGKVARGGMANRHRGIGVLFLLAEQRPQRLADNISTPQHHHSRTGNGNPRAHQQLPNPRRRAGHKARRV